MTRRTVPYPNDQKLIKRVSRPGQNTLEQEEDHGMGSLDELEQRVTALEERLQMEAELRAAGDRDLGSMAQNLRAQTHLVQALSITRAEHTNTLRELGEAVATLKQDHSAKLGQIIAMLDRLLNHDTGSE
jgi:hypothetical protein